MANKSYYHRSFIILKPLTKGFGLVPGKEPGGYCKFEIRRGVGKAYIYLQDLKPGSLLDGVYEAYLLSMDEAIEPYRLAGLHIDAQGRGEHIASFDSHDIEGTGYTLEHFHGLIIVFRSESPERGVRLAYPLVGYSGRELKMDMGKITDRLKAVYGEGIQAEVERIHKERASIGDLEKKDHVMTEKKGERETYGPGEEWGIKDAIDDTMMDNMEIDGVETVNGGIDSEEIDYAETVNTGIDSVEIDDGGKTVLEKDRFEIDNIGIDSEKRDVDEIDQGRLGEENPPEIEFRPLNTYPLEISHMEKGTEAPEIGKEEGGDREGRSYASDGESTRNTGEGTWNTPTYWDSVGDYFEGLFNTRQRVFPFGYDSVDTEWVRVQQFMPGGYYAEGPYGYPNTYPDHYIVGLQRAEGKVKNVIYGVPSMYSLLPPTSLNGFSRWVPMKEGYGMGYWLMYLDALSGKIISPQ